MGHRIAKHVYTSANIWEKNQPWLMKTQQRQTLVRKLPGTTYYVLDAQGNTMAVYQHVNDDVNHVITFAQTEKHIYGSSRLGTNTESIPMFGTQNATYSMRSVAHFIGKRSYELNNHLGNVLTVISDKVIPHQNGSTVDYWLADIRQSTDYSPFGVILKNRDLALTSGGGNVTYRFGFQGQERDDEIKGAGNSLNYEYRMHDPRIGRFFAIDPLVDDYPELTPYQFSSNRLIDSKELEGLEAKKATDIAFDRGMMNSIMSDIALGFGREEAEYVYPKNRSDQAAYMRGQIVGDVLALILSGIEISAGNEQMITGGLLLANVEAEVVTGPAGLATTLGGLVTFGHGTGVGIIAGKHLGGNDA